MTTHTTRWMTAGPSYAAPIPQRGQKRPSQRSGSHSDHVLLAVTRELTVRVDRRGATPLRPDVPAAPSSLATAALPPLVT